jgi:hypothetical protein
MSYFPPAFEFSMNFEDPNREYQRVLDTNEWLWPADMSVNEAAAEAARVNAAWKADPEKQRGGAFYYEVISGINAEYWPKQFQAIADSPAAARGPLVANFYLTNFWDGSGIYRLSSQDLASRVFDMSINAGRVEAVKILQRAIVASGTQIAVDGNLGPLTAAAADSRPTLPILNAYRSGREAYYRSIATTPEILEAWLRRAAA